MQGIGDRPELLEALNAEPGRSVHARPGPCGYTHHGPRRSPDAGAPDPRHAASTLKTWPAIVAVAALISPAAASAATSGAYSGNLRGWSSAPVTFRVASSRIRAFKIAHVRLHCGSFGSITDTFFGPAPRVRNNQFKGVHRYHPYPSIYAEVAVAGSFRGRKATGTIEIDAAPCLSSFRFSASWRHR